MPPITTRAGDVPDGVNRYCLPLAATGPDYAATIAELYADQPRY